MPKKTKKDKIIANQRRSVQSRPIIPSTVGSTNESGSALYTFKSQSEKKLQQAVAGYAIELSTIKNDLYKTILLAIIAFGVEIYLYKLLSH